MFAQWLENEFARAVRAGLIRAGQKSLPCQYLYDDVGSALFEAITFLPEYGLTRADARILEKHSAEIVALLPENMLVAELGSGSGTKTRFLLEALRERQPVTYYPIDIAPLSLARCARELSTFGAVLPVEATYLRGLDQVAARRAPGRALLVLFLGSTIGNFEPEAAIDFLLSARAALARGDAILLGTDLVQETRRMLLAYDDPAGVTAAFNLNLLARINRELDADFDLRRFEHHARYDAAAQRIEMHLRSRRAQVTLIEDAGLSVKFERGETIHTESCYKFRREQLCEMARLTGFRVEGQWVDEDWPFAETLMVAV